jgi:hypothetical protein
MKKYYVAMALLLIAGLAIAISHYLVSRDSVTDTLRAKDISSMALAVRLYASDNKKLPNGIKDLKLDSKLKYTDYAYKKNSASEFSICTNFKTDASRGYQGWAGETSKAGYRCLTESITSLEPSAVQSASDAGPQQASVCGYPYQDPNNETTGSTISSVDSANFRLTTTSSPGLVQTYYWAGPAYTPYIFDANCNRLKIEDVHVGQKVIMYGTNENILHYLKFAS